MFEIVETFLIQFISLTPTFICLILVLNLCSSLLWKH